MGPKQITATPTAEALLLSLQDRHGPLRLQISGSYGVTVICLPQAELRLGARDEIVGTLGDVPVTMMLNEARYWHDTSIVIDVASGVCVGFSLEGCDGVHFTLRKRSDPALRNWMAEACAVPLTDG